MAATPPIITPPEAEAPPTPAAPMAAITVPPTPEEAGPPPFPVDELEARLRAHLAETDVTSTTLKEIRKQMEDALGVNLKAMKEDIKRIVTVYLQEIEDERAAKEADEAEAEDEEEEEEEEDDDVPMVSLKKRKGKSAKPAANKPVYYWVISPALMDFLGVSSDRMEFKDAQRSVQEYIKTNLQKNEKDGTKYVCDEKLAALVGVKNIKLFGVGKQLKKHCKQWSEAPPPAEEEDEEEDEEPAPARKKAKAGKAKAAGGSSKSSSKSKSGMGIMDLKKPQSAYFLWMNAEREAIKAANPGATLGEIAKVAGGLWRGMSDKDKAPFDKMAVEAKRKYEVDLKAMGGKGALKKAKAAKQKKDAAAGGGGGGGGFAVTPYALSAPMQAVTGETELPRPQVVKKIWEYIKANDLQNPENKKEIVCDANLKAIFDGNATVTAFSLNKYISAHLTKIES